MVKKKQEFAKLPVNIASEKTKITQLILAAQEENDFQKLKELKEKRIHLEERASEYAVVDSKLEKFTSVNEKNRNINYVEGREAERAAILAKKESGARDYDPFARRKTAPKHVINRTEEKEKSPKKSRL
jgi:RNA polymerase-associated protein RTF1